MIIQQKSGVLPGILGCCAICSQYVMLPEKILKTCLGWTPPLGGIQLKATDKGADALGFPVAPP